MSSIVNKIKEAVTGEPQPRTTHTTGGYNNTGATGNTYATGPTGATGTAEGVSGPHSSRLANAADPRVDSDRDGSARVGGTTTGMTGNAYGQGTTGTTMGTAEGMTGPHSSRLANTLDPRVDSDMDGSNRVGAGAATAGAATAAGAHHHHHQHHAGGTTGMTGNAYGTAPTTTTGTAEGVSGPHSSRLANAVDPRVDSDRDGSARIGGATTGVGNTYGQSATGTTTGTSAGLGPHSSSLLNKLDPRVDSTTGAVKTSTTGATGATGATGNYGNASNYGNTGNYGNSGTYANTGTTGGLSHSTNAGPHDSNLANKVDPRVDSDLDHRGNRHGAATGGVFGASGSHATPGYGTAQNTAGPHNSDMMNKLDPRVDSDMDGSGTVGGNRTYASTGTGRDPTDAAHVPPSVLREHVGDPLVTHNNPGDNFSGRHGSVISDQGRHV